MIAGLAYLIAGPHSLDQLNRASKSVSLATPWHLLAGATGGLLVTVPRVGRAAGSVLLTLLLAVLLLRALPGRPVTVPETSETFRITAALALAWLFAAPYALPWYDGLGWATLALLAWSGFDWLLLARTSVLALAYLPARDPRLGGPAARARLADHRRTRADHALGADADSDGSDRAGGSLVSSSSSAWMLAASASGIATVNASAGIATPESLTSMPTPRRDQHGDERRPQRGRALVGGVEHGGAPGERPQQGEDQEDHGGHRDERELPVAEGADHPAELPLDDRAGVAVHQAVPELPDVGRVGAQRVQERHGQHHDRADGQYGEEPGEADPAAGDHEGEDGEAGEDAR